MKVSLLIIGALLLGSQAVLASSNQSTNPFLPPSARIIKETPPPQPACVKSESEIASAEALTALLEKEMAANKATTNQEPELPPGVYKEWTKEDVQKSRFIGQINNYRVYFHNEKQVFFNLDINKAKALDGAK